MESFIEIALSDFSGREAGSMRIHRLPAGPGSFVRLNEQSTGKDTWALTEGSEYRFSIAIPGGEPVSTDRPELFVPDDRNGRTGRLRTGMYVGSLSFVVRSVPNLELRGAIEIASVKLGYETDYRLMLRDLTQIGSALASAPFAATEQRYRNTNRGIQPDAYVTLRFILSQLASAEVRAAIARILSRPYRTWETLEEPRSTIGGWPDRVRSSQLVASGRPRRGAGTIRGPLSSIGVPSVMVRCVQIETTDNVPNRFVRDLLLRWRALCLEWVDSPAVGSGHGNARARAQLLPTLAFIDETLTHPVLADVGALHGGSLSNVTLQERAGYRELLESSLLVESAKALAWAGASDVFAGGQKNVAVLYEYWAYLQIIEAIRTEYGQRFEKLTVSEAVASYRGFDLRRGKEGVVATTVHSQGRHLRIEVYFNRSFVNDSSDAASWTVTFRPDISVRVRPDDPAAIDEEGVWLHFDAKYRVDRSSQVLGEVSEDRVESGREYEAGRALNQDLAKMHAYRDGIRRSAGAFVLYPGTEKTVLPEYSEMLPGLGAFPLRPSQSGEAVGGEFVRKFVREVVDHCASQFTNHFRGRYWERDSYSRTRPRGFRSPALHFLTKPPRDTRVLLGFVRDQAHASWITRNSKYNLRADDRTGRVIPGSHHLDFDLAVLFSPALNTCQAWTTQIGIELFDAQDMRATGYQNPRGRKYACVSLLRNVTGEWHDCPRVDEIMDVRRTVFPGLPAGAPAVISLQELWEVRSRIRAGNLTSGNGT